MPETGARRYGKPTLIIGLGLALISVLLGKCSYDHSLLSLRIAFAEEQTRIFEEMRAKALQADPTEAVEYLEYAVGYYPSGTKQISGSRLDRIVERARDSSIREIIASLRARTSREYGDNPNRWIDELRTHRE